MLFFSQRLKLCELFREWCEEKRVKVCDESFIAWLSGQNLLNEDKCHEIIGKEIENKRC